MRRTDSLEKTLMLGKRGQEKKGATEDMNLNKLREMVEDRVAWRATVHGVAKSRTQVSY